MVAVPLIVADHGGDRYLVAMLGERADWAANVRAAGGRAVLRHGRRETVQLDEVDPAERGPVVRRHLEVAPAARAFLPVSRTSPDADLDAVARAIPVFRIRDRRTAGTRAGAARPGTSPAASGEAGRAPRPAWRRRRWAVAIVAVVALIVAAGLVMAGTRSGPPPLALPATAAEPPAGPLEGRWAATTGSIAGFRVDQVLLGMHAAVVGRTSAVNGTVDVADGEVTGGSFAVDLTALTVNGKPQPQIAASLETAAQPIATIELDEPVTLPGGLAGGGEVSMAASGSLTLRGARHPLSITMVARRNGSTIEVAGSMPVVFAEWGIVGPAGYGDLGSLADHGLAEFLLVLERANG
jgi:YceI-like domain